MSKLYLNGYKNIFSHEGPGVQNFRNPQLNIKQCCHRNISKCRYGHVSSRIYESLTRDANIVTGFSERKLDNIKPVKLWGLMFEMSKYLNLRESLDF